MRGEVEVWKGDKLLHKSPNMLVDGAGVTLADIMTVSPSLSGVEDTATSSILDASNYTIQAISFGTGSDAFKKNAHYLTDKKVTYIGDSLSGIMDDRGISVVANVGDAAATSYYPEVGLPSYPDPALEVLESNTNVSAIVGGTAVSSVFPGNGQLTNFLPSAIMSSMMEDTVFSSTPSGFTAATVLGCFPEGSSAPYTTQANISTRIFRNENNVTVTKSVIGNYSFFNEVSSMDVSGFVNMIMSSVPDSTYDMSSTASGLTLSAEAETSPNYKGWEYVEYSVALAAGDVGHANIYGGIYHLGLWTIDLKKSLQNGNAPPYGFGVLNNPRKYRLFCRKGFTKNLCYIEDDTGDGEDNYSDLVIKWRIYFR
jgi:hypothetical protein